MTRTFVRPLFVPLLALILATGTAHSQQRTPADRAAWVAMLKSMDGSNYLTYRKLVDLAELDPADVYAIMREAWPDIASVDVKRTILSNVIRAPSPYVLKLLDLAVHDSSFVIQNWAFTLLRPFCMVNFADDFGAYKRWYARYSDAPIRDTIIASYRDFAKEFLTAPEPVRLRMLRQLGYIDFSLTWSSTFRGKTSVIAESGIEDALAKGLTGVNSPEVEQLTFQLMRNMRCDADFLRRVILPLTDKNTRRELRIQALNLLGSPDNAWATPVLLKHLVAEYPDMTAADILQPLANIGDPHAIPILIGILVADNSRDAAATVGNSLGNLTGVNYDETHDAAWWQAWWTRNRERLPADLRTAELPKLTVRKRAAIAAAPNVGAQAQVRQIGNDPKKSYVLIPPSAEPEAGDKEDPGLIVVLTPGAGNGADATQFWTDVGQRALKGRYYIALPSAPQWVPQQPIAWITRADAKRVKEARSTVEAFVAEIVKDVERDHKVKSGRVFLEGASDAGPAIFACVLEPATPFAGFYILSSPFRSAQLPPLKAAKGRRIFLQHSPDDRVTPYWMAAAAEKLLTDNGATVKLGTYHGEHGYSFSDDIYAKIAEGFHWLER